MKKLSLLLLCVLSTGCFYQKVDAADIANAEYFCQGVGGVNYIRADFSGLEVVVCRSGHTSKMWNIEIPEGYFDEH
jgi:hypothetical protein